MKLFSGPAPSEFIVASTKAIGKKLLGTMGWKEGQGLGPRVRSKHSAIVPTGIDMSAIPAGATASGFVTLAPENTRKEIVVPIPKTDMHGIGFTRTSLRGSDGENMARGVYRMDPELLSKGGPTNRVAGGVQSRDSAGFALGDDEDDVYDNSFIFEAPNARLMEEILIESADTESVDSKKLGAMKGALDRFISTDRNQGTIADARGTSGNRVILDGFVPASAAREEPERFSPIQVPSDFKVGHVFSEGDLKAAKGGYKRQSLETRSVLLSGEVLIDNTDKKSKAADLLDSGTSVFALLDARGREKIRSVLQKTEVVSSNSRTNKSIDLFSTAGLRQSGTKESLSNDKIVSSVVMPARPLLVNPSVSASVFSGISAAFKSRFATAGTSSENNAADKVRREEAIPSVGLWRIDRKPVEDNNGMMVAPAMASSPEVPAVLIKSSGIKVGKSMRASTLWQPQPLLCKRMGVPVPEVSKDIAPHGQASNHQSIGQMVGTGDADARFRTAIGNSETFSGTKREDELYQKHIGQHLTHNHIKTYDSANSGQLALLTTDMNNPLEITVEHKTKPPRSLFKSIFEPDDSSDDSSSDESSTKDSDSGRGAPFQVQPVVKGPSLSGSSSIAAIEERTYAPAADIYSASTNSIPEKVLFRKPIHKSSLVHVLKLDCPTAIPLENVDLMGYKQHQTAEIKKRAGALSFADEFQEQSLILPTKASFHSSSGTSEILTKFQTLTQRNDNASSNSSSDSESSSEIPIVSRNENSIAGSHTSLKSATLMYINADLMKEKLKGIIKKNSSQKKKKSTGKKDKKTKKEKKKKRDNKKDKDKKSSKHHSHSSSTENKEKI